MDVFDESSPYVLGYRANTGEPFKILIPNIRGTRVSILFFPLDQLFCQQKGGTELYINTVKQYFTTFLAAMSPDYANRPSELINLNDFTAEVYKYKDEVTYEEYLGIFLAPDNDVELLRSLEPILRDKVKLKRRKFKRIASG